MATMEKRRKQFILDMQNIYDLELDRWGNFPFQAKSLTGTIISFRLKLKERVIHFEVKGGKVWSRVKSLKYGNPHMDFVNDEEWNIVKKYIFRKV